MSSTSSALASNRRDSSTSTHVPSPLPLDMSRALSKTCLETARELSGQSRRQSKGILRSAQHVIDLHRQHPILGLFRLLRLQSRLHRRKRRRRRGTGTTLHCSRRRQGRLTVQERLIDQEVIRRINHAAVVEVSV